MAASSRVQQISGHLENLKGARMLQGEVAIITGSAQGIGRATAILFAKQGAKVVVSDLDEGKAQTVIDEIRSQGGEAIKICGDITAQDFPRNLIQGTIGAYGKINHIVNNAGYTVPRVIHQTTDEIWSIIMNVHSTAPFRIIREAAPYFREKDPNKRENRSITNVSSAGGIYGALGQINYAAAKASMVGISKTVSKEWGRYGVRCNTLAFGYISTRLTDMREAGDVFTINGKQYTLGLPPVPNTPNKTNLDRMPIANIALGRPGTVDEAASAILFLASPMASYVTSQTLEVNGGLSV